MQSHALNYFEYSKNIYIQNIHLQLFHMPDAGNRLTLPPGLSCLRKSAHLTPWPAACRHARSSQNARETIITIKKQKQKWATWCDRSAEPPRWTSQQRLQRCFPPDSLSHTGSPPTPPPRPLSPPWLLLLARPRSHGAGERTPPWHHLRVADDWDRRWIQFTVFMISVHRERNDQESAELSMNRPPGPVRQVDRGLRSAGRHRKNINEESGANAKHLTDKQIRQQREACKDHQGQENSFIFSWNQRKRSICPMASKNRNNTNKKKLIKVHYKLYFFF